MTKFQMYTLRVFVDDKGQFGNPVAVFIDENMKISSSIRQKLTASTGFSECVFINNLATGQVSIFNPIEEVAFAGHALVGTAHFLNQALKTNTDFLECKAGRIQTSHSHDITWIQASLDGTPPWQFKELETSLIVDQILPEQSRKYKHMVVWAWVNQEQGIVRARTFAPDWGIPEDEANGSGSMQLARLVNRSIVIHHGRGSVIIAKPVNSKTAEVGGWVINDEVRELSF